MPSDPAFDATVAHAKGVYDQLGPWIEKYHGGLPAGVLAAFINHESGGNFGAPGDPVLGEVGFLQVAAYVPPMFGLPPEARMDPESNIAIGVLEYELEAVRWKMAFPQVVLGTDDSWKLARMAFAIGSGGAHQLATLAAASVGLSDGDVYGSIVKYIGLAGGVPLGSQSAQKVASRVLDIERQWQVGRALGGSSGPPVRIPDPPAGPYTLPDDVAPYFSEEFPAIMLIIGGMAVVTYLLYRRRTS